MRFAKNTYNNTILKQITIAETTTIKNNGNILKITITQAKF